MKLALILLSCLAVVLCEEEIQEEENVLVLTNTTMEQALKAHKYLLVEFCKYSRLSFSLFYSICK